MDFSTLINQFFKACLAAFVVWIICTVIFDILGARLAPVCDPKPGDMYDASGILQTLHTGGTIMPAVIVIGGFARAFILAIRPDSQTSMRRY